VSIHIHSRLNVALVLLCGGLFLRSAACAQTSGSITGTVSNLDGDAVPNAPIEITNASTKATFKTASSKTGAYTIAQLPAGTYNVSITLLGYNPFAQQNVTVAASQTLHLDIHLLDYQLGTLGDGREFRIDLLSPHASTASGPTPRTREGKPDLSGVWYAQRPVDPGKPEPLPWAEALLRERAANNAKDAPGAHCLPRGPIAAGALFPFKLVQTPALLVMLFEDDVPSHRQVFLDGRAQPKDPNPRWMGYSNGHWDGDTLVVDTAGFDDRSWLDAQGHPHTDKMRITERFRRPDLGHLEIEITIDDPGAYAKPWVIKRVSDLDTSDDIGEYVCAEDEKDVKHMVGK
jgi:Carboxypeptidase regulatory-like domain